MVLLRSEFQPVGSSRQIQMFRHSGLDATYIDFLQPQGRHIGFDGLVVFVLVDYHQTVDTAEHHGAPRVCACSVTEFGHVYSVIAGVCLSLLVLRIEADYAVVGRNPYLTVRHAHYFMYGIVRKSELTSREMFFRIRRTFYQSFAGTDPQGVSVGHGIEHVTHAVGVIPVFQRDGSHFAIAVPEHAFAPVAEIQVARCVVRYGEELIGRYGSVVEYVFLHVRQHGIIRRPLDCRLNNPESQRTHPQCVSYLLYLMDIAYVFNRFHPVYTVGHVTVIVQALFGSYPQHRS